MLALFMLPFGAHAEEQQAEEPSASVSMDDALDEVEEDNEKLPFGGSFTLSNAVGTGTFVSNKYARKSLYTGGLDLVPYYKIAKQHKVSAYFGFYKYFVTNSETAVDERNQTLLNDVWLGYSYSNIVKDDVTGLGLSAGFKTFFPTSLASQYQTKIIGLQPSLTVAGSWAWFSASYILAYTQNFHEYETPVLREEGNIPSCINRGGVASDVCFVGAYANKQLSVSNMIVLGFEIIDDLSLSTSFIFANAFAYDTYAEEDALTGEYAQPGKTQYDVTQASATLSYQVIKHFSVATGVSTMQMPKTADNKSFRFPFYDASANNYTSISFSATASY